MDIYSKKQSYSITSKIYKFIKENPNHISIRNLKRNTIGLYEPDIALISVDPRGPVVPVLIHELLHHWHENWSETKILKEEAKIVRSLSVVQTRNILRMISSLI